MANTKITPHVLDSTLISGHTAVTAAAGDYVLIQDVSDSNALKKALVSSLTDTDVSLLATDIKIGEDDQTKIDFGTADEIQFYANNIAHMSLKADGEFIVNESGNAEGDFRVESDSDTHSLFVDAGNNRVGVMTSSPYTSLTVGESDAEAWISAGGANTHLTISPVGQSGALILKTGSTNSDPSDAGERMRITPAGKVGIGTNTSPGYTLTVEKSVTDDWLSRIYNTGTAEGDNGLLVRTGSEHDGTNILAAYSGSSYKLVVRGDGNVGINHTAPEHHLHVTEPASNEDGIVKIGGSNAGLGLELRYDQAGATLTEIVANPTYTNAGSLMKLAVDGDANPNHLVLTGAGNVGIGVTPLATYTQVKMLQLGDTGTIGNRNDSNALYIGQNWYIESSNSANPTYIENDVASMYLQIDANHIWYTAGAGTGTISGSERMRITSDGHVTQPAQPVAIYTHSTNTEAGAYQYNFGGTGATQVTCKPQTAVVNRGSMYNASNGRFTAPVAGIYQYAVHGNMYTAGLYSTAYWVWRIYKNGGHYLYHYQDNTVHNANGWVYQNAGGLISLAKDDYLQFELKTNNLVSNNFGMDLASYTQYYFILLY